MLAQHDPLAGRGKGTWSGSKGQETRRSAGNAKHPTVGRIFDEAEAAVFPRPTLVNGHETAIAIVLFVLPRPKDNPCFLLGLDPSKCVSNGYTKQLLKL